MNEIFDGYIENNFGEQKQCPVKKAQFHYNYKNFFPDVQQNPKCLDIGIGRGEMLSCLLEWGMTDVHGVDISPSVIHFCRSLNLPCELVADTGKYLHDHKGEFDYVTLLDVLEHITPQETLNFLRLIQLALKPGGRIIIQVPNMQAVDSNVYYYGDFTHCAGFTEHSLIQIFTTLKFSKYNIYPYEVFCYGGYKEFIAKMLRPFFHSFTRFRRKCIGAHCPEILTPVFFAVVER